MVGTSGNSSEPLFGGDRERAKFPLRISARLVPRMPELHIDAALVRSITAWVEVL